ncbi:MAG TPA: hypothetical protein VF188_10510 [Longimicrobiales bacterium]
MNTLRETPASSERGNEKVAGIVIRDRVEPVKRPVISAFIWGGKVRPVPTLPFGRWKPAA